MSIIEPISRSAHDVGLAAWFGGGLMGAVGVNSTARRAEDLSQRHQLAAHPWERWSPVNAAAVALHVAGTAGLLVTDRPRRGTRRVTGAKLALTGVALGLNVVAERIADKVERQVREPGAGGDGQLSSGDLSHLQDQLRVLRWTVTGLTGGALVLDAVRDSA